MTNQPQEVEVNVKRTTGEPEFYYKGKRLTEFFLISIEGNTKVIFTPEKEKQQVFDNALLVLNYPND